MAHSGSGTGGVRQGPGQAPSGRDHFGQAAARQDWPASPSGQPRSSGPATSGVGADGSLPRAAYAQIATGRLRRDRAARRKMTTAVTSAARKGATATAGGARRGAALTAGGARRGAAITVSGARATGRGARGCAAKLADQVIATAPRLPVRDQAKLRAQYPGRTPDELADALIDSAARMSASMGAAVGTWAVLPFMPGFAAQVAAETVGVVGIEIKLIAELHEVFGMRAPGSVVERMTAYVGAWANRRGVAFGPAGVVIALGSPLRLRLQRRLAARAGQSTVSLGPLMTGAAAGALINRHETRRLGHDVRNDLRRRSPYVSAWAD